MEYKDSLVAFIDILGFKNLISQSNHNYEIIDKIDKTLEKFKKLERKTEWKDDLVLIEESAQTKDMELFNLNDIKCTCFSDSIVISIKVNSDNISAKVSTLIANLSKIGAELLCDGILIRRAITAGNLIHKQNGVIYGQAMIDAYLLEEHVVSHSRVILSKELINRLNYPIKSKSERYPYHQYLGRFDDGCVGFTQLIYYQVMESAPDIINRQYLESNLQTIRWVIINGLDSSLDNPSVFNKYKWLSQQYEELIILESEKRKIQDVSLSDSRQNIHFQYINHFYDQCDSVTDK